jgi:NADPH-dependent 2,4-dienoyl-CoA reductase/sulfur reductase-like enzyme/peroxiredoxin family protein/rhodanese-related sulfurtransferase/TusA-related sulfurtransferase
MKHLIIGGVAGGATAAARIRRADDFAEIILIEKGKYISYANCGLPYYIGGIIKNRDRLFVQTPEAFAKRSKIDVRVENTVVAIDTAKKIVTIRRADGTDYTETYDKLLLSPGATPVKPPLDGIETDGIFTLRNVDDTDKIKTYLDTKNVKNAVVIGAGFIGMEMVENLANKGVEVSIVESTNQVMNVLDFSIAALVHQYLLQKNVNLCLEETVEKFEQKDGRISVCLKSGQTISTDIVILSIGVRPEISLAQNAGLKIGETGGIWVDEFLQTSAKDVYAVGDAIEFPHPTTGKPWMNFLAGPANRQGRIVADNMVKNNVEKYEGSIGTAIAKIFDLTVATTGLSAKKLEQLSIRSLCSTTHSASHAGYYPGSTQMSIKLAFDPKTGKLYGAQVVGYEGVDKRIDQAALIIKSGGTVFDLRKIEHSYAPPFSSAKDPLAIAGYAASNIVTGDMAIAEWREVKNANPDEITILDVRLPEERMGGLFIPNSINIPLDDLRDRANEIPKDKPVFVHCAVGHRGSLATRILRQRGFDARNVSGGFKTYSTCTMPLKSEEIKHLDKEIAPTRIAEKTMNTTKLDATGLQCPLPILKLKEGMDKISVGDRIEVTASDAGFVSDVEAWSKSTGNTLISNITDKGEFIAVIEKGEAQNNVSTPNGGDAKTFIMFSDDLDRALATFVLANGAAATGKKVTIFFTFWGLDLIKKVKKPKVKKDVFEKMFGIMLPSHSLKLKLSKWNMFGIGAKMMRYIMKEKGIASLEMLRQQAIDSGVEFIGCQMSMTVMGVKKEELLDNVVVGGVATYMARAEQASVNLFI